MRILPLLLLLLLIALPLAAQPAPAPVAVTLEPATLTVGDPVRATIALEAQTAELTGDPRFPAWGTTWGDAEVLKAGNPVKVWERDGKARWEQRLTVTVFRPGKVALPAVEIAVPFKTRTVKARSAEALALEVRSVLPKNEPDPQAKPAAPPVSLPLGERFWWTVAGLGALCLLLGWLLFRRRAKAAAPAVPALPPFEELAAALDRLAAEPSPLALHTGLSLVTRRYLSRRLPFPALESTTTDVQRQLLSRRIPGPVARRTVELLWACDLVKFARQPVGEAQTRERLETARKLAHEYEVYLAPREPEKLEAAG